MLSITSSQPVHWPPSPSPGVAPVSPVGAVAPAQNQVRDQASGAGAGREGRAGTTPDTRRAATDKAPMPESTAAPLLPRDAPEGGQRGEGASAVEAASTSEQAREAEAEDKAAQQLQLREVLSNVWKASAAVVDVVLGRDAAAMAAGENTVAHSNADARDVPGGSSALSGAGDVVAPWMSPQHPAATEPVTYTEQGASVWGAVETGTRLNQKA